MPVAERGPASERGAALLTVLLLVAVMAVITAVALERLTLASRMAQNGAGADQGRALLIAGEAIAAYRLGDLVKASPGKTTLAGGWLGTPQSVPVPGGSVVARVTDAGLGNLRSLTKLKLLELVNTRATTEGIRALKTALPACQLVK